MAKRKTIMVGRVPYSMRDLRDSLKCANVEAQGYLDQLKPLRDENATLRAELAGYQRARVMILTLLGVDTSQQRVNG